MSLAHQKALTAAQVFIAGGRTGYEADLSVTRFYRIARAAGLSTATTTGGASIMCAIHKGDVGGGLFRAVRRGRGQPRGG